MKFTQQGGALSVNSGLYAPAVVLNCLLTASCLLAFFREVWPAALLLHLLAGVTGLRAVWSVRNPGLGPFEVVLAFALPGIGGSLLWCTILLARNVQGSHVMDQFLHYIDPGERLGRSVHTEIRSFYTPRVRQLAPFADILRSGVPLAEKRIAMEGLARVETPAAILTLRELLTSDSVEIRFYASSILTQLEERLALRLSMLERGVFSGARIDPEVDGELAQTYLDYAYYGLIEGVRRQNYLERAITHAEAALERGARAPARLILGRAQLALGLFAEAEQSFHAYLASSPDDPRGHLWLAEACFRQGKYHEVNHECRRVTTLGDVPEGIRAAVSMWV